MQIGTAETDGATFVVAEDAGRWRALDTPVLDLVQLEDEQLRACFAGGRDIAQPDRLLAPLRPRQIIAVGLNYADHVRESGMPAPSEPLLFSKLPSTVIGPTDRIDLDAELTQALDYEVELAVVIGCPPPRLIQADPLDHVFGYTVANDISARDLQGRDGQWTRGKGLRTSCPLGPMVVVASGVPDPQALRLTAAVNGRVVQDGTTADMVFDIRALVTACARAFALWPGDVVLTGTPAGVGMAQDPPLFLRAGDVVTCTVELLGEMANTVRLVQ